MPDAGVVAWRERLHDSRQCSMEETVTWMGRSGGWASSQSQRVPARDRRIQISHRHDVLQTNWLPLLPASG